MNNLFSKGLLTISVVALYGCNNSVDLTTEQSSSHQATSSTSNHAPTTLIVATPPATIVGVVNITNEVTTDTTKAEDEVSSSTSSGSSSGTSTNTNSATNTGTMTTTGSGSNSGNGIAADATIVNSAVTSTDSGTDASTDNSTNSGTDSSTSSATDNSTNTSTESSSNSTTNNSTGSETNSSTNSTTNNSTDSSTDSSTSSGTDSSTNTTADNSTDSSMASSTSTTTDTSTDPSTETSTSNTPGASTSLCDAVATPITPFVRVQMHYGLMSAAPFIMGELGGLDTLTVTTDAAQGDTVLNLDSTTNLVPGQLLTYVGSNGFYRAARIDAVNGGKVSISSGLGLETAIPAGSQVSNFYNDPTHPNVNGYRAIADFGYRSSRPIEPNLTHVLLGDSWFDKDERSGAAAFENQLQTRLPGAKIVNAGIGGNTLCDLLERFDSDVASQDPQYVWINSSINDYFNDVSPQDYKTRMQILISKVQAIGAKAIVFDSAPSTSMSPSGIDLNSVSNAYASAVLDLYTETQP